MDSTLRTVRHRICVLIMYLTWNQKTKGFCLIRYSLFPPATLFLLSGGGGGGRDAKSKGLQLRSTPNLGWPYEGETSSGLF